MHFDKIWRGAMLVAGCLTAASAAAGEPYLLDAATLDRVTAGTQEDARNLADFDFVRQTGSGRTISGTGSLALANPGRNYNLLLGDGAQSHLRSLVNINAVDANITVLLNLNINVESTVGTLTQNNLSVRAAERTPAGP